MRYPLSNWPTLHTGYTFGVPTFYSHFHLGLDKGDKTNYGWNVWAVTDGVITLKTKTSECGNLLYFLDVNKMLWRFMHLSWITDKVGTVPQGTVLGKVGNGGLVSPPPTWFDPHRSAHLHMDISLSQRVDIFNHSNFIDPQKYLTDNKATLS